MKGKVKWFSKTLHFGFIRGDDEQDYFVHQDELEDDVEGDSRVEFEIVDTKKGFQARKVTLEVENV